MVEQTLLLPADAVEVLRRPLDLMGGSLVIVEGQSFLAVVRERADGFRESVMAFGDWRELYDAIYGDFWDDGIPDDQWQSTDSD